MAVMFINPFPIESGCKVELTFPSDIPVTSSAISFSGLGLFAGVTSSSTSFQTDTANNKITVSNVCPSAVSSSTPNIVQITSMPNPPQKKTTDSVQVLVKTASDASIMQKTSGITLADSEIETGSVGSITATPAATLVQASTTMAVGFTPVHAITASSRIIITFPSTLTLGTSCSVSSPTGGLDAGATCTADNAAKTVTLDSPFGSNTYAGGTALAITISNVENPVSVQSVGAFAVATYNVISGTAYMIDTGTATSTTPYTVTSGSIVAPMSATPGSLVANAAGVTYTISFTPSHKIPSGGKVKVTFPSDVTISDTTAAAAACSGTAGFQVSSLTCNPTSSSLDITNGFTSDFTAALLTFSVGGCTNPRTTKTSASWQIQTTDSSDNLIDTVTSGITVSMSSSSLSDFTSVGLVATDKTNGASTTYTFSVVPGTTLISTDYITIAFPSEVSLASTISTCTAVSKLTAVACALESSSTLKATLTTITGGSATSSETVSFTVGAITNPPSTTPSSAFTFLAFADGGYGLSQYSATAPTVTNTAAGAFTSVALAQDSNAASTATSYTVTATLANQIPASGIITLIYPSTVSVASIACSNVLNIGGVSCALDTAARKVTASGWSATIAGGTSVQFSVATVTNPATQGSTAIEMRSYTTSAATYIID